MIKWFFGLLLIVLLSACSQSGLKDGDSMNLPPQRVDSVHFTQSGTSEALSPNAETSGADIPLPVEFSAYLEPPKPVARVETYTVVVSGVPLHSLLFSLARDAKLNVDIDDDINETVTINAVEQSLEQILDRVVQQTDVRYRLNGSNLVVEKDRPYIDSYRFDYPNLTREMESSISLATQISSTGSSNASSSAGGNNSASVIRTLSKSAAWDSLITNIEQILEVGSAVSTQQINETVALREREAEVEGGAQDESNRTETTTIVQGQTSIIANRESGVIMVRATQKQHKDVRRLLEETSARLRKQVLIEATVVEVRLSEQHQQGVDWQAIQSSGELNIEQSLLGTALNTAPFLGVGVNTSSGDFNITSTVKLLDTFGDARVLSSPKIMALNNQNAILKVVDNLVYFTLDVDVITSDTSTQTTFESTINTVPVGFVMTVMPYISDSNEIILNVRPTLSRVLRYVNDPNPDLANAGVESLIPEIQVREMESVLRMNSGQVAILGGLMQDSIDDEINEVPLLGSIPLLGGLFRSESKNTSKTELVVFMRPIVVDNPSINEDLRHLRDLLPDDNTLNRDVKYREPS